MTAVTCPDSEKLKALSLGQLSTEESDDLIAHVASCEACRSDLDTVNDIEDSLIASLRDGDELANFDGEPDCQLAMAKALGALADAGSSDVSAELTTLPRQIGEYEVVRPLGRGGMGSVYLARHTKLGRQVALKVLAHHRLGDKRHRDRFEAEMRAIGRLSHPNIVTAHDARDVGDTAVLVTEYIDGFDLGQLLHRTGPISVADASEIVRHVAVALEYTSRQGFVHRDVKPSNVMLGRNGEVKLLDLGLARFQVADADRPDMTGTGQAMGTADFVAPEQITDSRAVDVRADIYGLGCTLFKLLTGSAPFDDDRHATVFAKMTAHVSTPPPSLAELCPDAPSDMINLVDSMLTKDPDQRPQSPMDVAERLAPLAVESDLKSLVEKAAQSEPDQRQGPRVSSTTAPQTQPWLRRQVPMGVLIATGLGALAIGFVLGVLIKIEFPDGTIAEIRTPDDARITMSSTPDSDSASNNTKSSGETTTAGELAAPEEFAPLSFAILLEHDPEFAKLVTQTELPPDPRVIEKFLLYPLRDNVNVPHINFDGRRLTAIDTRPGAMIRWKDIQGHVRAQTLSGGGRTDTQIDLEFDDELAAKMKRLTEANLQRRLAIIMNKEIIAAPIISSSIDNRARIHGRFNSREIRFLMQALMGGLVDPIDDVNVNPWTSGKEESAEKTAHQHLRQLALGMINHESSHRRFPASEGRFRDGQEISYPFSWRVAILPFIDRSDLYEQYRFEEPWSSEHNLKLVEQMPDVFRSPFAPKDQKPGLTNYVGFASHFSALALHQGVLMKEIRDGTSNTLLIVEAQASIPWTKPEDPQFIETEDAQAVKPLTAGKLRVAFCDGSTRVVKADDLAHLAAMITRNGAERVDRNGGR